jgi:hypothetical protein
VIFKPYTQFGKTKEVLVIVYLNNELIESDTWDLEMWIENGTDMYGLMSTQLKNKKVRIIRREDWIRSREVST